MYPLSSLDRGLTRCPSGTLTYCCQVPAPPAVGQGAATTPRALLQHKYWLSPCHLQVPLRDTNNGFFWPEFPGKTKRFDGRSGEAFDQPVTVGRANGPGTMQHCCSCRRGCPGAKHGAAAQLSKLKHAMLCQLQRFCRLAACHVAVGLCRPTAMLARATSMQGHAWVRSAKLIHSHTWMLHGRS